VCVIRGVVVLFDSVQHITKDYNSSYDVVRTKALYKILLASFVQSWRVLVLDVGRHVL